MKKQLFFLFLLTALLISITYAEELRHWTFDTDFIDESGYGAINSGTVNGTSCPFGNCLDCERDDTDYIDLNHSKIWGENFSISVWATLENPSNGMALFGGRNAGIRNEISYQTDNNDYRVVAGTSGFDGAGSYANSSLGVFTHFVITQTNTSDIDEGIVSIYVNGDLKNTSLTNFGWYNGVNYFLCDRGSGLTGWDGMVDELWIFNHTVSSEEALNLKLYNSLTAPARDIIDVTLNSPPDNFLSNQNLSVSYSPLEDGANPMNCSLYVNDTLDNTNLSVLSGGTYDINYNFLADGIITYYVNCSAETYFNVTATQTYEYDSTNPIIYPINPSTGNATEGATSITINFTCVNTNLDSFNITVYNDSAKTVPIASAIHEGIGDVTFTDDTTTFNFTTTGTKYIQAVCSDSTQETEVTTTYFFDNTPPTHTGLTNNATGTYIGVDILYSITFEDNYDLGQYIFSENSTGTFVNDTPLSISGVSSAKTVIETVSVGLGNNVCAKFFYEDSFATQSVTELSCYNVTDSPPPTPEEPVTMGSMLEESGTGMAVMVDRVKIPIAKIILILSIVLGIGVLLTGLVTVISGLLRKIGK